MFDDEILVGSLEATRNMTIRQTAHDFRLAFHSNYDPILYCFQNKVR